MFCGQFTLKIGSLVDEITEMVYPGLWTVTYPGYNCTQEVVIVQDGEEIVATKVVGDEHVPAGEVTFVSALENKGYTGKGRIVVADHEFSNPEWVPMDVTATSRDHFVVEAKGEEIHFFRKYAETHNLC
jgi:hypothetical protein